jgi:predicted RNA binding protein YcfA (HicA-like mRNA interferase family)
MPQLKVLSGRELRAILEENGFVFLRQSGSHMIMQHPDPTQRPISVPDHRTVAIGTYRAIIRQSGLARSLFETQ